MVAVKVEQAYAGEIYEKEQARKSKSTVANLPQSLEGKARDKAAETLVFSSRSSGISKPRIQHRICNSRNSRNFVYPEISNGVKKLRPDLNTSSFAIFLAVS